MRNHYAPGEQGGKLFRDEVEGRGAHGLRGGYAMDALRAEVALRIHQRLPPAGDLAVRRHVHDCQLDDPVASAGGESGGFQVDDGIARHPAPSRTR
jgi:hypothetical protein